MNNELWGALLGAGIGLGLLLVVTRLLELRRPQLAVRGSVRPLSQPQTSARRRRPQRTQGRPPPTVVIGSTVLHGCTHLCSSGRNVTDRRWKA